MKVARLQSSPNARKPERGREAGEPLAEIGRSYNVSHSTISRLWPQEKGSPGA
jgi:hypothetical protein